MIENDFARCGFVVDEELILSKMKLSYDLRTSYLESVRKISKVLSVENWTGKYLHSRVGSVDHYYLFDYVPA